MAKVKSWTGAWINEPKVLGVFPRGDYHPHPPARTDRTIIPRSERKMGKKGHRDVNKKTIPQLQNTLWPIFSKWTKLNHSEDGEWCNCFTCQKSIQIGTSDCHGGHFIPRTYSPTKYEEGNVRPQCGGCNGYGGGKPLEFERNLRLEIGDQAVDDLKEKSLTSWKWNRLDLISMIEYYKQEIENMLEQIKL